MHKMVGARQIDRLRVLLTDIDVIIGELLALLSNIVRKPLFRGRCVADTHLGIRTSINLDLRIVNRHFSQIFCRWVCKFLGEFQVWNVNFILAHYRSLFWVNTPDSSICRIMRFARLKPIKNLSLMPEAVNLFCPCAYAKTSSNNGSQLFLSKVLFSIVIYYIYGLQSG